MVRLDFGKFKGYPIDKVPTWYLQWCMRPQMYVAIRQLAFAELARRGESPKAESVGVPASLAALDPYQRDVAKEIIDAGRRTLAMRYHPDLGGDAELMRQINILTDLLHAAIKD